MCSFIRYAASGVLFFLFHSYAFSDDLIDRKDWQLVEIESLAATSDYQFRHKKTDGYLLVTGDFNGDGVTDRAEISKKNTNETYGLIAYVSRGTEGYDQHILNEGDWSIFSRMGISREDPGEYKTACGKGYGRCKSDAPLSVSFPYDAINFFMFDSASMFFIYKNDSFYTVWISD
ncbi:MAG: hypothetical protein JKY59_08150 [Emcibacter sp.]|nr:hypothetical protein [Emcibacter sp.]